MTDMMFDNRGRNYNYQSSFSQGINISGVSESDFNFAKVENEHLKRKLEQVGKQILEHERELYGDIIPQAFAWTNDKLLDELNEQLVFNSGIIETNTQKFTDKTHEASILDEDIKKLEREIKELNKEEIEIVDKIEHHEIYKMLGSVQNSTSETLAQLQPDFPLSVQQHRLDENQQKKRDCQSQLREKQDQHRIYLKEIEQCRREIKDAEHRFNALKETIEVRVQQISEQVFDKNQNGIFSGLEDITKYHEAIVDTSPEVLSHSMPIWSMGAFTRSSNEILGSLATEIERLRRPATQRVFESFNSVVEMLQFNIELRKKYNDYLDAFTSKTTQELYQYQTDCFKEYMGLTQNLNDDDDEQLVNIGMRVFRSWFLAEEYEISERLPEAVPGKLRPQAEEPELEKIQTADINASLPIEDGDLSVIQPISSEKQEEGWTFKWRNCCGGG